MHKINFFTPVNYPSHSKSTKSNLLEKVDNYFYLGGKKAFVQGIAKNGCEKVILSESKSSLLAKVGKIFSYFTIAIPLLMLAAKSILRATHRFKVIDPKQKLEKKIDISEQTAIKVQSLIPDILKMENKENINYLKGPKVFQLKEHPNLVFKLGTSPSCSKTLHNGKLMDDREVMEDRYNNMIKAKEICLANDLGLLKIPFAKKFTFDADGKQCVVIAEEHMDIDYDESAQQELYHQYCSQLNATMRQLAVFIAKTGFNDVTWRNIPILNEAPQFQGSRRVALIDLEHMQNAANGFIGDINGSCGLIRCVSKNQIDTVITEARKHGVALTDKQATEVKNMRLQELKSEKALRAFHEKNAIITGKEPIKVDLESLGLDLTEEVHAHDFSLGVEKKRTFVLRKVAEDIIAKINESIQDSPSQASVKNRRYITLNTNVHPFISYEYLPDSGRNEKQLWLHRVITALVEKGCIFKLEAVNGYGYSIQT